MFDIRDYCERVNIGKPDIFELCKDNGIIHEEAETVKDLIGVELEEYQREVAYYYNSYRRIWKEIFET